MAEAGIQEPTPAMVLMICLTTYPLPGDMVRSLLDPERRGIVAQVWTEEIAGREATCAQLHNGDVLVNPMIESRG